MLASKSLNNWPQNPSSDHFGDFENITLIDHEENHDYFSQSHHHSSSLNLSSKSRSSSSKMPSKSSSSRRSSTVDGDYEWDDTSSVVDTKKKSRSKLPAEDKLVKRRDQNRVSQRAFRQRKEKHTKELEAKVEELESLLETASHENSIVTSQMSRMEEELCYYRRLLFSDASPSNYPASTAPSTTSTSMYSGYSPAMATIGPYVNSPRSHSSSSAHSSPSLSNIPGDFGPVATSVGTDGFWGYEVPSTQGYMQFDASNGTSSTW